MEQGHHLPIDLLVVAPPLRWYTVVRNGNYPAIGSDFSIEPETIFCWGAETDLSRAHKAATFLLALAAALLLLWQLPHLRFENSASVSRAKLAAALGPVRPLRGRFAGGFEYAPYGGAPPLVEKGLSALGKEIERAARSQSPQALADLAVFQILTNDRERARKNLEAAAKASGDPSILSDLAAVLLDTLPPSERIRALEVARQAAEAGPNLLEAQCNFALALDEFGLVSQAREAWSRCLQLDDGLGWATEVEERLQLLERPTEVDAWEQAVPLVRDAAARGDSDSVRRLVSRLRERARLHVEEVELSAWAVAAQGDDPVKASRCLQVARAVAEALRSLHGDTLLTEAVSAIDGAIDGGDRDSLRNLTEGHAAYGSAQAFFNEHQIEEAVAEFERATEAFRKGRSPFRGWAIFRAQLCRHLAGTPAEEILPILKALGAELDPSRHRILEARRLTLTGMAQGRRAHFAESAHLYQDALGLLEIIGEREHLGSLHYMLGENLRLQGEIGQAWEQYLPALLLLRDIGSSSVFFQNTLLEAAEASLRQALPSTSRLFYEEMVRMAEAHADEDPLGISEALLRRSRAYLALGDVTAARQDLVDSRAHAERIEPGEWRDRLMADLDLAIGEVELEEAPEEALERLTAALNASLRSRMRYRLPDLYEIRAKALLKTGSLERARDDLELGIIEVEAQRRTVLSNPMGAASFERARSLFDEMIGLESRLGQTAVAFEYAERSKARSLLEMVDSAGEARVLGVGEVQRELPARMALVEFSVLKDQTLAWVVTPEVVQFVPLDIGEQQLERLVGELRSALIGGGDARRSANQLYQLIVQPLRPWIGDRDLIVVPDRSLHVLPFAALINPATGRYLLEERAVAKAPSATLWVKALQQDRALAQGALSGMLVIGNPAFDRDVFGNLTSLEEAGKEALEVAATHPGARLLVEEHATKRTFLDEAPRNAVIHLAMHAWLNLDNPLLSALLLAQAGDDPGVLYAHEIYRMRFTGTRLVVLSGCGTSTGKVSAREGAGSLARAFLAAGVPAVVGSLWDMGDKAAPDVLIAFHRRLSQGEDALSALRGAQLEVLRRSNLEMPRPDVWAGFELIGGVRPRSSGHISD